MEWRTIFCIEMDVNDSYINGYNQFKVMTKRKTTGTYHRIRLKQRHLTEWTTMRNNALFIAPNLTTSSSYLMQLSIFIYCSHVIRFVSPNVILLSMMSAHNKKWKPPHEREWSNGHSFRRWIDVQWFVEKNTESIESKQSRFFSSVQYHRK